MINEVRDEYGVYERLARLETQHESTVARLTIVENKGTGGGTSGFTLKELVTWLIIGATLLGQGPQAIEIAKVLLTK